MKNSFNLYKNQRTKKFCSSFSKSKNDNRSSLSTTVNSPNRDQSFLGKMMSSKNMKNFGRNTKNTKERSIGSFELTRFIKSKISDGIQKSKSKAKIKKKNLGANITSISKHLRTFSDEFAKSNSQKLLFYSQNETNKRTAMIVNKENKLMNKEIFGTKDEIHALEYKINQVNNETQNIQRSTKKLRELTAALEKEEFALTNLISEMLEVKKVLKSMILEILDSNMKMKRVIGYQTEDEENIQKQLMFIIENFRKEKFI